jgi:hypothetical protein
MNSLKGNVTTRRIPSIASSLLNTVPALIELSFKFSLSLSVQSASQ